MKISTKGRYALRLLLDLAQHQNGEFIALKDIASRQNISKKYLEQIVPMLNRAGFLLTGRGYQGGYQLAKNPNTITVGDILRVTEGSLSPISCLEQEPNQCPRCGECLTLPMWQGLFRTVNNYLDSITIQDILDQQASGNDYVI
ncbi:MAG: Rrf2 family transcriptional regulator [Bariatricus sp.]|nr:Rrf2 family transcriptional regulator [Bariatricus sp.]